MTQNVTAYRIMRYI